MRHVFALSLWTKFQEVELNAILILQSENVTIFSYILLLRVISCLKKNNT